MYNFDKKTDRKNTNNVKYDLRQTYFGKDDVLPMWVADMDFETPDFIRNAVIERANHPIYGYSTRPDEYYQTIIDWVNRRLKWKLEKECLLFSPGVVPALNLSVLSFTEPGDNIIVQPPVYFPFFSAIKNNGRKMVTNPLVYSEGKYSFDFEDFEKKAKNARMLFLCSPHNPVGRCWTEDELKRLTDICIENDLIIMSDEIHNDLILPGFKHIPTSLISDSVAENTVTCIAPSKTFNIAGLATSTVIIKNEELRKKFQETIEQVHIANGNLFGTIASIAGYKYGDQWLESLMEYVANNISLFGEAINNEFKTLDFIEPEATYLGWIDFRKTGLSDKEISETLVNKAGLGFSPGPIFGTGGKGFQRINLATPKTVVEEAVDKLKKAFV